MMEEMKWVVGIKEELERMKDGGLEMPNWKKHSIYKIPTCVTDLNKKAYSPQMVSFGPYHHGEEHLMGMEEHKHRALLHFLKRCGKPIELLVHRMAQIVQDLCDSYEPLDTFWKQDTPRFLQLMILDGCFMMEILRIATRITDDDYAPDDPVFGDHGRLYIMPYIRRDMFMLENQLPMMVLETLIGFEGNKTTHQDEELLNKLILKFFSPVISRVERMGKCLHALDVYKKSVLKNQQGGAKATGRKKRGKAREGGGDEIIRSATELNEAGIRFKKSKSSSLKDLSFNGGVLRMPVVVVDDTTETMYLNLIAFERFHVGAGNEVTSFVFFMDNIIDHERDVALLHSKGIIKNALGSDKAVANLFNSLSRDIPVDQESTLELMRASLSNYYKKPWNKWRANLIHTYFRSPWALLSLVAAIFLFGFTIVQTVYSVLPYYKKYSPPTPHPLIPRFPPGRFLLH